MSQNKRSQNQNVGNVGRVGSAGGESSDQGALTGGPQLALVPELPKNENQPDFPPAQIEDMTLNVAAKVAEQKAKPSLRVVKALPQALQDLIENGIPVRKAVFHRTVIFDYAGGTPETAFYCESWSKDMKKNKIAKMWYTPHGLVCEQAGLFKIIPLANVSDTLI